MMFLMKNLWIDWKVGFDISTKDVAKSLRKAFLLKFSISFVTIFQINHHLKKCFCYKSHRLTTQTRIWEKNQLSTVFHFVEIFQEELRIKSQNWQDRKSYQNQRFSAETFLTTSLTYIKKLEPKNFFVFKSFSLFFRQFFWRCRGLLWPLAELE